MPSASLKKPPGSASKNMATSVSPSAWNFIRLPVETGIWSPSIHKRRAIRPSLRRAFPSSVPWPRPRIGCADAPHSFGGGLRFDDASLPRAALLIFVARAKACSAAQLIWMDFSMCVMIFSPFEKINFCLRPYIYCEHTGLSCVKSHSETSMIFNGRIS